MSYSFQYARRKVESNWTKYDDFVVDDEREAEVSSEPRGEDFQKLAAKSGKIMDINCS